MINYPGCGFVVQLHGGYTHAKTKHGDVVSYFDLSGLHREIAAQLVLSLGGLTRDEFRFLRREAALTQKAVASLFGYDEQSLSSWERGLTPIPVLADAELRRIVAEKHGLADVGTTEQLLERVNAACSEVERVITATFENGRWGPASQRHHTLYRRLQFSNLVDRLSATHHVVICNVSSNALEMEKFIEAETIAAHYLHRWSGALELEAPAEQTMIVPPSSVRLQ